MDIITENVSFHDCKRAGARERRDALFISFKKGHLLFRQLDSHAGFQGNIDRRDALPGSYTHGESLKVVQEKLWRCQIPLEIKGRGNLQGEFEKDIQAGIHGFCQFGMRKWKSDTHSEKPPADGIGIHFWENSDGDPTAAAYVGFEHGGQVQIPMGCMHKVKGITDAQLTSTHLGEIAPDSDVGRGECPTGADGRWVRVL